MFKKLLENMSKKYIILSLIFTIIFSIFNISYTDILSNLAESVLSGNTSKIALLATFYMIYLGIWEVVEYFGDWVIMLNEFIGHKNIGHFLLNRIYKLKPSVIKKYNTGYINGVVSSYIHQKMNTIMDAMIMLPISIIYILFCFIKMCNFHIIYGLALLIVLGLSILFRWLGKSKIEKLAESLTTNESNRNKNFIDTVSNIGTAQKMESISYLVNIFDKIGDKCIASGKKFANANQFYFAGFKLINYLYLPIVCFIYYLNPSLVNDPIKLFSFISVICVQLVHVSRDISVAMIELMKFTAKTNKLEEIICNDNLRAELLDNVEFKSVEILNVNYSFYNENDQVTTVVKIPRFKVDKGDKICIYGESGQGKTTTLNILSGEIQTGQVLINGQNCNKRLDCCYIAQDNSIFDLSLRDNLALGKNVSDEEIIDLINKCGLHDWFKKQSNGLDTMLGERGIFVSTGQRQRLNLIRGLLVKDKEIYLLDEPTSNVDDITEDLMIKTINEYLGDKTVIIVTHRPKIKALCNKFYKFTDGVCIED